MNLAPPPVAPRRTAPRGGGGGPAGTPWTAATSTAKSHGGTLQRERHQPDYTILVAVVSLASVGILMVYSSSAMRGYLSSANDTFAIVGSADPVGAARVARDGRDDARRLPLPAARVGAVLRHRGHPAGARLRAQPQRGHRRFGALAAYRAAARDPSRRDRKARTHHLSRPLDGKTRHATGSSGAARSRS